MAAIQKVLLNTGVEIPILGNGSWAPETPEAQGKVKDWTLTALQNGYRHLDTAMSYGTEAAVGEAIRASGIPREEIFVTTKLPYNHQGHVAWSFEKSLQNLGLDYIDLYLIHWPQAIEFDETTFSPMNEDNSLKVTESVNFSETWAEFEKFHESGKVRAIGVSNFSIKTLEELFKTAKITPAVNQVELHPYLSQEGLREYCASKGIVVAAYSPSGHSIVRNDPVILGLAEKYKATPTQVILAWHIARGNVTVAKSEDSGRQKENITLITLSPEDVEKVSKLDRGQRICNAADEKGQVYGWTLEQLGWDDAQPHM